MSGTLVTHVLNIGTMRALGQEHASGRGPLSCLLYPRKRKNRRCISDFGSGPQDEIATAIARCAGWFAHGAATGESIDRGEAEPSITTAGATCSSTVQHELGCFRRSRR